MEALHPKLPGPEDRIVDFPEGKQEAREEYPPVLYQALGLSQKLEQPVFLSGREGVPDRRGLANECSKRRMPAENTYFVEAVRTLDTHRTPIQKQLEVLLCLVGISRRYYLGDKVYPTFLYDDDRGGLIRAPNPIKVKTRSRPRVAHEVPLLTVTANRVIEMEDPAAATDSSGVPSTIERSPLDFATEAGAEDQGTVAPEVPPPEDVPTTRGAPEAGPAEGVAATDPSTVKESRKKGRNGVDANAPPKVLRKDHADPRLTGSTRGGKSLAAIELGMGSTRPALVPETHPWISSQGTAVTGDPESENASFASMVGSPKSIYRPGWGIANGSMLDTPEACQDLVDHVALSGYFSELRHLQNNEFLRQYNVNLSRQVAMGSQLRLRFEQEVKLLKKSVAQVAHRDKRIQAREQEIKNLEALLEAEADMKKAAEDKSRHPTRAGRRWMIGHGLRLVVVKCSESLELRHAFADVVSARVAKGMSEGLRHGVEHGRAQLDLEALEAYDSEAEAKYIAALQALKDLKYPLVDQLEGLKDAPMDVIMVALYLESDTGDDAPQWVRNLRPSSSQLTICVYPEVRDPMNPWACKEEMLLADAIAANVSRAKKKKNAA
nr:hypothetical protein [Tanacetum cinerariifolium]